MIHDFTIEVRVGRDRVALPWADDTPPATISLRSAGDLSLSRTDARASFIARHGWDADRLFALKQVHSHTVWCTDEIDESDQTHREQQGDGLITGDARATLTVTVADCLPIFLYDRRQGVYGLCHSGWKGTGIVVQALTRLTDLFATRPGDMTVLIGPGIGPCCYDVPVERFQTFWDKFGDGAVVEREGRHFLDLRQANVNLLLQHGVEDIWMARDCTKCHPALSSFRGQGREDYIGMMATLGPRQQERE